MKKFLFLFLSIIFTVKGQNKKPPEYSMLGFYSPYQNYSPERLIGKVEKSIQRQVERTRTEETSPKNTTLYFSILLETKDLIKANMNILNLYFDEHNRNKIL